MISAAISLTSSKPRDSPEGVVSKNTPEILLSRKLSGILCERYEIIMGSKSIFNVIKYDVF